MATSGTAQRYTTYGDARPRPPLPVRVTEFLRNCFGMGLGLGAILLPAMVWRDMEALYAQFGAPVVLAVFAPLVILVCTYGRADRED